jgi:UDP:flavonoid glycosyltransferase YjiC (YdhE family)
MKILLTSIGTRGDMEPFMAIGEILLQGGHDVICLFPEQFRAMAESSGFRFASLGSRFIDMIESEDGKAALGGSSSGISKLMAYIRLGRKYQSMNREMVEKQREVIDAEQPDRIVHNGKVVYPVLWGMRPGHQNILVTPVPYLHYVEGHSHLAFNSNFGPFFNKLTFSLARFGLVKTLMTSAKWLGLGSEFTTAQIRQALATNQTAYTISPTLFPRPAEWPDNLQVLGYHERDKTVNWQPEPELMQFLERNDKVLLVTFGSMTNPEPEEKTRILLEILHRNRIPTLINTAAGGLVKPTEYDSELIYFVDQIPYDWVLPRIYGAIHHGGSGTTHMALKHACATMIIPHIIDQFVWNKLVAARGAGPKGIPVSKLKVADLEPKVVDLFNNPGYKQKAEELARSMGNEDYREALYRFITESGQIE